MSKPRRSSGGDSTNQVPLLGATRTRILKELSQGPRTAVQLGGSLSLQVSAVRKHLERLRSLGIVEPRFARAGPGRPKKFYRLTDDGRELFPRHYDVVLNALVAEQVRDQGKPAAERTLRRVAQGFARAAVPEPGADRAHLRRLVAGLEDLGFEPELTEQDGDRTIVSRNCPILRTARVHRELVCAALHAELLRAATGASQVRRGTWIVDGDPVCTHTLHLLPRASRRPED